MSMPTKKYDWIALKAEFMHSQNYDAVWPFLREKIGRDNGENYIAKKTKGWTQEKMALRKLAQEEAQKNLSSTLAQEYSMSTERLSNVNSKLLVLLEASVNNIMEESKITMENGAVKITKMPNLTQLERLFKMTRIELDRRVVAWVHEEWWIPTEDELEEDY